ncbi:hypothetical protein G6F23_015348 [Rhizopus arrhizus]|nr:hypothetical protein G6F23_015348 [Rhizopus arrhizus]
MAPLAGIRAESLQADDRAYFADAAAEQRARDALEKQLEALQHAAGIAPAQRRPQRARPPTGTGAGPGDGAVQPHRPNCSRCPA